MALRRKKAVTPTVPVTLADALVIGNSHTGAIGAALAQNPDPLFRLLNLNEAAGPGKTPIKLLKESDLPPLPGRAIFSMFGGSEHLVLGLIEMPQPFDLMTPTDASIDGKRSLITFAQMVAVLDGRIETSRTNWRTIRAAFDGPIWHVAPPPPFRALREGAALPEVFREKLSLGIAPAQVRRRLYDAQLTTLRRATASLGIGLVEPPPQAVDAEGYLRDDLWTKDPTHANGAYGALVLGQMRGLMGD